MDLAFSFLKYRFVPTLCLLLAQCKDRRLLCEDLGWLLPVHGMGMEHSSVQSHLS